MALMVFLERFAFNSMVCFYFAFNLYHFIPFFPFCDEKKNDRKANAFRRQHSTVEVSLHSVRSFSFTFNYFTNTVHNQSCQHVHSAQISLEYAFVRHLRTQYLACIHFPVTYFKLLNGTATTRMFLILKSSFTIRGRCNWFKMCHWVS